MLPSGAAPGSSLILFSVSLLSIRLLDVFVRPTSFFAAPMVGLVMILFPTPFSPVGPAVLPYKAMGRVLSDLGSLCYLIASLDSGTCFSVVSFLLVW